MIRYPRSLIEERAREVSRIQKVLEGENIKLSSVASNVLGKSGRAMIEAMIAGETDPEALSDLEKRKLKSKKCFLIIKFKMVARNAVNPAYDAGRVRNKVV